MKTRVLYPKNIWFDKHFKALPAECKNLCLYLVTNENVGLTRTYEQHDAEICFVLGISEARLIELKDRIQEVGLFIFKDEWVYINNDFAYVDYQGRDRVIEAKDKELSRIPKEIDKYFKEVIKGLKTGYKPAINHKPKTINHKSKTINPNTEGVKNVYLAIIEHYNQTFDKQTKSYEAWKNNCDTHLKSYSVEDIKLAITSWKENGDRFWAKEPSLELLFRMKNKNNQPCDYIDQLLNLRSNRVYEADPLAGLVKKGNYVGN